MEDTDIRPRYRGEEEVLHTDIDVELVYEVRKKLPVLLPSDVRELTIVVVLNKDGGIWNINACNKEHLPSTRYW